MTFWVGVAVAYVVLAGLGLALGRYLADRFPGRGDGGIDPWPTDIVPTGPSGLAMDVPPLGSAFDRALLPGAFDGVSGRAGAATR